MTGRQRDGIAARRRGASWRAVLMAVAAVGVPAGAVGEASSVGITLPEGFATRGLKTSAKLSAQQDAARSAAAYTEARQALNLRDYGRAAELFRRARRTTPSPQLATDAAYWEAFALYRVGGTDAYREALATLEEATTSGSAGRDADELYIRIRTELALRGDAESVAAIASSATLSNHAATSQATISVGGRPRPVSDELGGFPGGAPACTRSEHTLRIADLNALRRVRGELALPVLRSVLLSRDECSALLRRHAVLLTMQTGAEGVAPLLIDAARHDPDPDVRAEAVFWLSEVPGDEVPIALAELLHGAPEAAVRERAAFALSRHDSPLARVALRRLVGDADAPLEARLQAVAWLAADLPARDPSFLAEAYGSLTDPRLRDGVIQAVAASGEPWARPWLRERVLDPAEATEARKVALFRLGQTEIPIEELLEVYAGLGDDEMREHAVFVLGQRPGWEASRALLRVARSARTSAIRDAAVFWLEQRSDPAALAALADLGAR